MDDIELQYNNRARVADHAALFEGYARDAAAYREERGSDGLSELGVSYGPSARQFVDIFLPDRDTASAHLAVFIHGGYWQIFAPDLFSHMARGVNRHGVPMAVIGYDLAPEATLDEILRQTRAACIFLDRRYGRRLVVSGHSAGGHLAACLLATDWRKAGADEDGIVAASLAVSGVFELSPLLRTSMNVKLKLTEEDARRLSPIHWTPPPQATIDAWVGGAESEEFLRQSREFGAAWQSREANAAVAVADGANHFTIVHALADPDSPMTLRLVELCLMGILM